MNLNAIHSVYFLGIGGIGMSALARYFHARGVQVSGYDRTRSPLTRSLEEAGIAISYEQKQGQLPESLDMVVFTPAIPSEHPAWAEFEARQVPVYKRAQVLGMIAQNYRTLAVAGTHGKTTTSAMLTHVLNVLDGGVNAFVGGVLSGYDTNWFHSPDSSWLVAEADEYDRSFLALEPAGAIVTSVDADHLDIYGSAEHMHAGFQEFANQVQNVLLVRNGLPIRSSGEVLCRTYGIGSGDYRAENLRIEAGYQHFEVVAPDGKQASVQMALPGRHNVENATAALALLAEFGHDLTEAAVALASFRGVKRRFEWIHRSEQGSYIDDYAHHPTELDAVIGAVRMVFPDKPLCGIFQPHLFSRTRDFEAEFARSLAALDTLILLDIYPAREQPIEGVSSKALLERVPMQDKQWLAVDDLYDRIRELRPEVLLTLGAGDIDRCVAPLKQVMEEIA